MKMYGFDDNNLPHKYITIANSEVGAYNEFLKKGIKAELDKIYEVDTTVIMIHNPLPGVTRVTKLRDIK